MIALYAGLDIGFAFFWTLTYVLIIRRGLADRTYGMPLVALSANISWELIFAFVRPAEGAEQVAYIVWFALDLAILYTAVRYGPLQFPQLTRRTFYAGLLLTLVLSYLCIDLVSREVDAGDPVLVAFGQNLVMSALFISMLMARGSLAGQSATIATTKLVGTALASAAAWSWDYDRFGQLMAFLWLSILLLDLIYLVAVIRVGRSGRDENKPVDTAASRRPGMEGVVVQHPS